MKLPFGKSKSKETEAVATINHIFVSPDGQEYVLVLVESNPWSDPGTLPALKERVELTYNYIESGELARAHPKSTQARKRIAIDYMFPPDPTATAYFQKIGPQLEQKGVAFQAELLENPN